MSTAQDLINIALAQAGEARAYAGLVPIIDASVYDAHAVVRELQIMGLDWAEAQGNICLRVGPGNDVWDGRDYRARRLAAYQQEIPTGLMAEALCELNETPSRPAKWQQLQAIRKMIKARFPKPEEQEEP